MKDNPWEGLREILSQPQQPKPKPLTNDDINRAIQKVMGPPPFDVERARAQIEEDLSRFGFRRR